MPKHVQYALDVEQREKKKISFIFKIGTHEQSIGNRYEPRTF